ncbi:hypothetical protein MSUIS_07870 [Mycoplasma suis KI3806]|uniref:Uncharacterized protein n=1 Tax=Mycoplasma suis (strain KI_3806) TaxID=708248 RepID=F0V2J9_MYCS3|nr:hypothetical protein MSUIS_07870 [Mycoplasma suis KI3806]
MKVRKAKREHQIEIPTSFLLKAIVNEMHNSNGKAWSNGIAKDLKAAPIFPHVLSAPKPLTVPPIERKNWTIAIVAMGSINAPDIAESRSFSLLLKSLSWNSWLFKFY